MLVIYKFTLERTDTQTLTIQEPAIILSVKEQHNNIVIYAIVDNKSDKTCNIDVLVVETGHSVEHIDSEMKFLDTVKLNEGNLISHIFIRRQK